VDECKPLSEGIAETVDAEFDIYSAAMPYAARRALAPTTRKGEAALRQGLTLVHIFAQPEPFLSLKAAK
jgi:hypothetical protein